ncbi:MAG: hypothetical protein ABI806_29740 [Candidatus Solibacter sp.]
MIRAMNLLPFHRGSGLKRVCVVAVILGCGALLFRTTVARADSAPDAQQVQAAKDTSDLMLATLFAALLQEFAETTPANVEQGKKSISLIFDDRNDSMRLVGKLDPLSRNDLPDDSFEKTALGSALQGQPMVSVQKDQGKWYYRRSVPLSNFSPACAMCHANFGPVNDKQWVGALMLRIPVADSNK